MTQTTRFLSKPVLVALALAFAVCALAQSQALAASADGVLPFQAKPVPNTQSGYFKFVADPGSDVQQALLLVNPSDKAKTLNLAAVDGASSVYGGVGYTDSGKTPKLVGSWIRLSKASVVVPAGGTVKVPFTVSVPSAVASGDHVGGIAMWEPAATKTTGSEAGEGASTEIKVITRMVLTVFVTTPGPKTPNLTISGVTAEARPDGMYLVMAIASDGTAFAGGDGVASLPDDGFTKQFSLAEMVPQSSTQYPILWKTDPGEGAYAAQVEIKYADGTKVATWSGDVTVASKETEALADRLVTGETPAGQGSSRPWLIYALVGGLVVVIIVMAFALLRRRRPATRV